jgi:Iron-containing alcohol dehydrogenase
MNSSTAWRAIWLSGVPWRFRDGRRLNQSDKIASKILVLVCPSAWLCMVSHLTWKGDRFSSMNFSISLSSRLKRGLTLDMVTGPTQLCSHKDSFKDRQVRVSLQKLDGFRHWHRGFVEWAWKAIDWMKRIPYGILDDHLLPTVAIVDYELTFTMPASLTAAVNVDTLTHAIEACVSKRASALTDPIALSCAHLVSKYLRRIS